QCASRRLVLEEGQKGEALFLRDVLEPVAQRSAEMKACRNVRQRLARFLDGTETPQNWQQRIACRQGNQHAVATAHIRAQQYTAIGLKTDNRPYALRDGLLHALNDIGRAHAGSDN